MEKRKRRGQANIIALILIILIVIVAILILWNIIIPLVREKGEKVEMESLVINLEVEEAISFVHGALKVSVSRGAGKGEITGLEFVFSDESGNRSIETRETTIEELGTRTYYFSPQGLGKIEKISVVPVIGEKLGKEFKTEIDKILEIPASLVSWWKFDDTNDFIGRNNCQLISGGASEVLSGEVNCGNDLSLDIEDKMAISFWIKTDSNQGNIIKKGDNYEVSLVNKNIKFSFSNGFIQTSNEINNSWNHVVVSVDADAVKKIYINNEVETFQGTYNFNKSAESLVIGGVQGEIDEVMIFNEPLSHYQAVALYNHQKK